MDYKKKTITNIIISEIERIGNIKRNGIIINCDEKVLTDFLQVKMLTREELIDLRNLLVEELADRVDNLRTNFKEINYDRVEDLHAIMTVVTGIIDKEYYRR